ncbi:hypothetical protein E2C01_099539 [Portunus trituberculatus]|uniref:Uncharacterized protein n=1 Tax=Portunus trituberculatus TaxID=210409 RepID=A0A5B7K0K7_PORTR|nr:hypothetical protein [Portunus trituberculatus]
MVGMRHRCLVTKNSTIASVSNPMPGLVHMYLAVAQVMTIVAVAMLKVVVVTDNRTVIPTVHCYVFMVAQPVSDTISSALAKIVTKTTMPMAKSITITVTESMPMTVM